MLVSQINQLERKQLEIVIGNNYTVRYSLMKNHLRKHSLSTSIL